MANAHTPMLRLNCGTPYLNILSYLNLSLNLNHFLKHISSKQPMICKLLLVKFTVFIFSFY